MTSVLVSGAPRSVSALAKALRDQGADVTEVVDLDEMTSVCETAGSSAFDAYVQLSATFQMGGDTAIDRVHNYYANGVLGRFRALRAALPALAGGATVTFVLPDLPPEVASPDDRSARQSLTKVLAHAARADAAPEAITIHVLGSDATTREVVGTALGRPSSHAALDDLSDLDYADWRVEVLGLAALET
jgi:hypothetical protein